MKTKKTWWQRLFSKADLEPAEATNPEPVVTEEYISVLTKVAVERRNQGIRNSSNGQAAVVFYLMIGSLRPNDEVCIYSNALSHPFYSTILLGPHFLRSKAICKIVLDDKAGFEIIKKLPKDAQSRIDCRFATTKDGAHMIITKESFRLEIKKFVDELFTISNFYDPDSVEELKKRFDRIWVNAIPFPLI